MRRLIVMRHAKSAWDTDAPDDHARPLSDRGRRDAPRVGERLAQMGWFPQHVIASDSVRTTETWEHMASAFSSREVEVVFTRRLYHGGLGAVQNVLEPLERRVRTAMVLGHNPGFEHVVAWLSGEGIRLTTGNAALLLHPASEWKEAVLDSGGWSLEDVLRPKEL